MPLIVATCVITVPSLIGGYAKFGLTDAELITLAIDHVNRGDIAYTEHPEYQRSGCVFSDTIVDLAVEIINLLPAELESDYDQLTIIEINDAAVCLSLEFKD
ncbi:hypothetical protein pEaSNUABM37_00029 [Erwinia phage pEa_SNUABM_37]|nr:hypothetical protein pEaSNUABM37_00029 [Erwinia phage pEa_SNUABM_37]QXO10499.1 hypothetical protein pEaSNUABM48_00029 [Erwinia phage pEa_SNUABM_48]